MAPGTREIVTLGDSVTLINAVGMGATSESLEIDQMQDAPKMLLVALVIYEVGINESTTMSKIFEAYRWYTEEVLKLNQQADKSTVKLWVVYLSNNRLMLRIKRKPHR